MTQLDEKRKPPEVVGLDVLFGSKGEVWCVGTGSMGLNDGDIENVKYIRATKLVDAAPKLLAALRRAIAGDALALESKEPHHEGCRCYVHEALAAIAEATKG
jgi:hypothetical protein